jgi:hypothetical protein
MRSATLPLLPAASPPPRPAGNITLDSGGYYNAGTVATLNDALNLLGIRVTCPKCALATIGPGP